MPHSRHGNKMERKENLFEVNEVRFIIYCFCFLKQTEAQLTTVLSFAICRCVN